MGVQIEWDGTDGRKMTKAALDGLGSTANPLITDDFLSQVHTAREELVRLSVAWAQVCVNGRKVV